MSGAITISYSFLADIWTAYLDLTTYLAGYTATGNIVDSGVLSAARSTLKNEVDYINGVLFYLALVAEIGNIEQGLALPVPVASDILSMAQARLSTMQSAASELDALLQPNSGILLSPDLQAVATGSVGFPDPGILDWIMNFYGETPPSNLTPDNFSSVLAQQSINWTIYATALLTAFPYGEGDAIEAFNRQSSVSERLSGILSNFSGFSSFISLQVLWNSMAVYPILSMLSALLSNAPANALIQSARALTYIINNTIVQLDFLLAKFSEQNMQTVRVINARQNDSLPNIAARELGDFELWPTIAAINGLTPPYQITQGQQLFLPPSATPNTTTPPNYLINYLGVDLYYSPLDQDMLVWSGDFYTISGYENLSLSLTRGIITTIGTLIYHLNYGSRVPPEVGNVETAATALNIGAYANSSILYDPRVSSIITWDVVMLPNNQISYTSTIQPNGQNVPSVTLNLVLQP